MYNILNEGFKRKYMKEDLFDSLKREIKRKLKARGYNVEVEGAEDVFSGAAEYIEQVRDYDPDSDYSVDQWIRDTEFNYPQDLAFMLDDDDEDDYEECFDESKKLKEEVKEKVMFHNDNGEDYEVIERSKSGQNALLNKGKQWIIAWNCPESNEGSWGQGHYFFREEDAREVWEDKYLNESLKQEDSFDFNSDFYNAISEVMFKYRDKDVDEKDLAKAYEFFELHFFDNEFYEKLQECINRLNEAEMSDEDKKDSEILWNIYNKTQQRANAKLTDEEKATLNKYNLTRVSDLKDIYAKGDKEYMHGAPLVTQKMSSKLSGWRSNTKKSDINLADRARKMNDRGQGYGYHNTLDRNWRYDSNDHREYKDSQTGKYVRLNDKGLLDAERDSENIRMQEPVSRMKNALDTRNQKQKSLASMDAEFDAQKADLQKEYERKLADLEKRRGWHREWDEDSLNSANATINKLLKKDEQ